MAERKKIFLVDDNLTNLMAGKNMLKDSYELFTMSSAEKMFELLKKVRPDAILLDVEMPGISGYEALDQLKAGDCAAIPVLFVSAHNYDEAMAAHGAAGHVKKPFLAEELHAAIKKITL